MSETATFAGGCFWCLTKPFQDVPGVASVTAGYSGCRVSNPTYEAVCGGETGCLEAVRVAFDPAVVAYASLAALFFRLIDPTDDGGQFCDRGTQYRTAVFFHSEAQRSRSELARLAAAESGRFSKPIVTAVRPFSNFYEAEEYHQNYHARCPLNYRVYHEASGRPRFLNEVWDGEPSGKAVPIAPPEEELREKLSREAYNVAVLGGTERPTAEGGRLPEKPGLYVDALSGAPLFHTSGQFESGCGWPSFTRPFSKIAVAETHDSSHNLSRTEVRAAVSNAHLGHVFGDGPAPTGLRYCINLAALRFIPDEQLAEHGYKMGDAQHG